MQQSNVPEPVAFQLLQGRDSQNALTAVGRQGMLEIVVLQLLENHRLANTALKDITLLW